MDAAWLSSAISSPVLTARAARKTCCPSTTRIPSCCSANKMGNSMRSTPNGSFCRPNFSSSRLIFFATPSAIPASGLNAPRSVEIPARAPDSARGRTAPWWGACGSASASAVVVASHGLYSWWCFAAEPKSHTIGSLLRVSREKRMSLSTAQVPMWVADM